MCDHSVLATLRPPGSKTSRRVYHKQWIIKMRSGNDSVDVSTSAHPPSNSFVTRMTTTSTIAATAEKSHEWQAPSESSPMPPQKKKHKKRKSSDARLRKLWRRATTSPQGITSRAEWSELSDLHSDWKKRNGATGSQNNNEKYPDALPGPSITIRGDSTRDFRSIDEWQHSKASDHRDILVNLLFGGGAVDASNNDDCDGAPSNKKRKKQKAAHAENSEHANLFRHAVDVPSLPSWASMGNLASIGGMAVIEIDIDDTLGAGDDNQTKCPLMPSELLRRTNSIWETLNNKQDTDTHGGSNNQVRRIIGAACKVKMFQGDFPRCISDELMFFPPPSTSKLGAKRSVEGHSDLFQAVNALKLDSKQMQAEGFPRLTGRSEHAIDNNPDLYSKTLGAKEMIGTIYRAFWNRFIPSEKSEDKSTMPNEDANALELVEALSIKDTVCFNEERNISNEDEFSKFEFFVQTFSHDIERPPKIFAMDCEMVQTSAGPELARVSVVLLVPGENGHYTIDNCEEKMALVFDELVKPRRAVLDYLTDFSGITPTMLEGVNTRLEDVQAGLLSIIEGNDIIVGHSLENDLKALRLLHHNVVDTSVVFRGVNGRKYGLRHLSNVLLKKQIQNSVAGHCSYEDAEAALLLALRRAKLGPAFQLKENSRGKNIMRVFQSVKHEADEHVETFAERNKGPCVCIGSNCWISKYAKSDGSHHVLGCESLMNSMAMAIPSWLSSSTNGRRSGFLWANLSCDVAHGSSNRENEVKRLEEIMVGHLLYSVEYLIVHAHIVIANYLPHEH
ncbi:hypothetical protein HJC23_012082 [Cyclotella cryptica]|uniref:Exonuclease domain-containing protein n=1 Tax=Cyclotella cryptica TaxID=29204 RepID=A0ABD3PSX6_9STRA|eukprot:CCRYP_011680-RC/>CCRYP_011680-RC protein AED:0.02 eAED:0.02 QI:260/1/1/1/1/1/3/546/787